MPRFRHPLIAAAALIATMLGAAAFATSADDATPLSEDLFRNIDAFWSQQVASLGGRYRPPKLTFFSQPISGACDLHAALVGPFYCPVNETVYLDAPFLQRLMQRARSNPNMALGYVIAREVAHHIQNVIGTTGMVDQARARSSAELAERTLTTMELQTDCYAGLWAHWAETHGGIKDSPDVSAALEAAAAIGQELQKRLPAGQEMLDPLTHGSPAQRLRWFRRGLDGGRFDECDTFGAQAAGNL